MVRGLDRGTTYMKTDNGLILRSTVRKYRENEVLLNDDKNIVEYEGHRYVVGEKGNYSTDLMKAKNENTKLLILTALGLSFNDEFIATDIVTGLPIGQYSSQKEEMKALFRPGDIHQITLNGQRRSIKITGIEIFPEAAGAFYSQNQYTDGLVIDIGGLSIDTALFQKKKLVKYSTYSMGIMKLYSKLANEVNSRYDLSLAEWDIERILKDGLYIYGEKVELDMDFLVMEHVKEIVERLKLEYDLKLINNVLLTGGGSQWIHLYFKNEIPQSSLMENAQLANAIGYKNIGKVVFR